MKFWMSMLIVSVMIVIGSAAMASLALFHLMETITPGIIFQMLQEGFVLHLLGAIGWCFVHSLYISVPLSAAVVAVCYVVDWLTERFTKKE